MRVVQIIILSVPHICTGFLCISKTSYSGADGLLYTDMQGIDTALQLVKRVIVDI